jgi:LPS-assembly protein
MRRTLTPHEGCGLSREGGRRQKVAGFARAFLHLCTVMFVAVVAAAQLSGAANAQDPSIPQGGAAASSFAKQPGGMFGPVKKNLDTSQPLYLQGDQLIYDTSGTKVTARGNVEIYYNDNILTADEVIYDQGAGTLTARGNVTLKEPQGNIIHADTYTLTDDFRDGFVQSLSVIAKDESRIAAERATRRDGNVTEFKNGKFTACKSDGGTPPLWCISAAKIIHDKDAAVVTYQDAYFEIYGQPVFYLPYFQHPDPSVKRQSGFLMPGYGNSNSLGFMTEIPYFFNLAPNYDFTFTPRYLSQQGVVYQGEWRHRLADGTYIVKMAALDQDAANLPGGKTGANTKLDGWRGSLETKGQFSLGSWWKFGWDVTLESDDSFRRFYKYDNILLTDRVNQIFLTGQSDRNYFAARLYHFGGLLLDDTKQAESYTHPIIDYNYVFADPVLGGELKWDTNIVSFTRIDGTVPNSISGKQENQDINRIVTELKWRRRFTDAIGITYTPFANLRGDIYQFNNFNDPTTIHAAIDPATGLPTGQFEGSLVSNDTTVRGIAAGGAIVSYPWVANTVDASHIIEPIGQIIARQDVLSQRRLPNEDARSIVFDDNNLFEVSKFSGYDRTEVGTRVNTGVQYTFQANTGGYARVLAGESFHISGDNVYKDPGLDSDGKPLYSPSNGLQTQRSDYVLGAYIAPVDSFRLIAQSRFDSETFKLRREDVAAQFIYGPVSLAANYAYMAADPILGIDFNQQDIYGSSSLRLTDFWSLTGGFRFDLEAQELRSNYVQARYADECFVLTASYFQNLYESATIPSDETYMLRLEFKHIGEYNYKTNSVDFAFGGDQKTN